MTDRVPMQARATYVANDREHTDLEGIVRRCLSLDAAEIVEIEYIKATPITDSDPEVQTVRCPTDRMIAELLEDRVVGLESVRYSVNYERDGEE